MFQILKRTDGGFRKTSGTALKNDQTGDIVYVPPQNSNDIIKHMTALEEFMNDDDYNGLGLLVLTVLSGSQKASVRLHFKELVEGMTDVMKLLVVHKALVIKNLGIGY